MCDIIAAHPDIKGIISIVGWETVASRRICNGTDNGTLPCPDIIVVGTTQLSGRYYQGEVEPLDRYFEEYNEETGMVLQDDFFKASHYDYRVDDSWIGVPLTSDLRALYFNKNTLATLGLKPPPPSGIWVLEKYIRQSLLKGVSGYLTDNWAINNNRVVQSFLSNMDPKSDILSQLESIKTLATLSNQNCPTMNTIGIVPIGCIFNAIQNQQRNDIGYAFPPGPFTFVGGSGAVIAKFSKNKNLAWKYLSLFLNQRKTYMPRITAEGSPPPLQSFGDHPGFGSALYNFAKKLMKRGIPVHYPSNPYSQWAGLEILKPFRMMMFEMRYKNFSAEVATERACQIIDYLFEKPPRDCDQRDYKTVISDCLANNTKILSYVWDSSTCKNASYEPPQPIYDIDCSFVVAESASAAGISAITAIGAAASTLYSIGFLLYRNKTAIKAATVEFCLIIFFGSILMYTFVLLQVGPPSEALCIARPWFLVVGFAFFFGGFLIKMMRINLIFTYSRASRVVDPAKLSLVKMLKQMGIVLLFEISALVALSTMNLPGMIERTIDLPSVGSFTQRECAPFNQITVVVLLAINAVMIAYGSFIAWRTRNVPDAYNETKFVMVAMVLISFTAVAVIPVSFVLTKAHNAYLLQCLAINFATTVSMGIFALPKLWAAYNNITPRRTDFSFIPNSGPGGTGGNGRPNPASTYRPDSKTRAGSLKGENKCKSRETCVVFNNH
ncbi:hypothetical protein HK102_004760 [Quaeritorhiza haematococci]|nr:hypothetical protein HK102_004760 [Quaeritorhiza haematococci]